MIKIKAGGVYYKLSFADDPRTLDTVKDRTLGFCWGLTDFTNRTIKLYRCPDNDETRVTFFHELTHAIVDAYHITTMMDDDGRHQENNIDLMGVGLKEAFDSLGIDILDVLKAHEKAKKVKDKTPRSKLGSADTQ